MSRTRRRVVKKKRGRRFWRMVTGSGEERREIEEDRVDRFPQEGWDVSSRV